MIPKVSDIHTHDLSATDAVISLPRLAEPTRADALYSVGVHPWWADDPWETLRWVERLAAHPQVALIGECGLDTRRGALPLAGQLALLERQVEISERVGKPLILHIVGAWSELLALRRHLRPVQPWIVHGFRGKPALARQLLAAGLHISLGPRHNPLTAAVIPPDRLHRESD